MGLFDKKYCSVCGEKIGLMGNRKLEDGNLCKNCAGKLSPWFSERRSSTVEQIKAQLAYREENRAAVENMHTTLTLGEYYKVQIDEDAKQFVITRAKNLADANPDVLQFSQVTGCNVDVQEHRSEVYHKDKDGKSVSYNPKIYEYSYDFYCEVYVNHPYFDELRFKVNDNSVKTGRRSISETPAERRQFRGGQAVARAVAAGIADALSGGQNQTWNAEYNHYLNMCYDITDVLMQARQDVRDQAAAESAPKQPVTCPNCGATVVPDGKGCCEYCGSALI